MQDYQKLSLGAIYWRPKFSSLFVSLLINAAKSKGFGYYGAICRMRSMVGVCLQYRQFASRKIRVGNYAEGIAIVYLLSIGFEFIERNWKVKFGELDLVMKDGDIFVFVEVKSRICQYSPYSKSYILSKHDKALSLFDNVSRHKSNKLRSLVGLYLGRRFKQRWPGVRIDLIGVSLARAGNSLKLLEIQHILSAV